MDQNRRKELKDAVKRNEKGTALAVLPSSNADLEALFDSLDAQLATESRDHSQRLTMTHVRQLSLSELTALRWLKGNGGDFDCEVIASAEQAWGARKDFERKP